MDIQWTMTWWKSKNSGWQLCYSHRGLWPGWDSLLGTYEGSRNNAMIYCVLNGLFDFFWKDYYVAKADFKLIGQMRLSWNTSPLTSTTDTQDSRCAPTTTPHLKLFFWFFLFYVWNNWGMLRKLGGEFGVQLSKKHSCGVLNNGIH